MKRKHGIALALCLLLPLGALAVTEGAVEEAPMVEVRLTAEAPEASYLPDASYYAGDTWAPSWENAAEWVEIERSEDGFYEEVSQSPRLTKGEAKRAEKLLADYKSGKAAYTGESVLEKMEDVIVGVYRLDPADYDGEAAFVILPGTCLTDEQLLSIIAAFEEMGQEFDPNALNYLNCMRGGGIETSRFFSAEERERYAYMSECIKLGKLVPPAELKDNAVLRNPALDSTYFCNMSDFSIKPYRSMTDEELVSLLLALGVHDERGEIDHSGVESRSRGALYTALGCPLSMELEYIYASGAYTPMTFTSDGHSRPDYNAGARESIGASFTYHAQDGYLVYTNTIFDKETDELMALSASYDKGLSDEVWPGEENNVTQAGIDAAIASVEERLGLKDLAWRVMTDDETWTNWGACIPVRAQVAQAWQFTIYIGKDDGQARGWELTRGTLVETLPDGDGFING